MNLILLPGNHPANNQWIFKLEQQLAPYYTVVATQHYAHWDSDNASIDIDHELEVLVSTVKQWPDYAIFAKSAGVLVTLKGIHEGKLNPQKCIFVGLPSAWAKQKGIDFDAWIKNLKVPTLFIQKAQDPAGSFANVQELAEHSHAKQTQFVELPGSDHHYEDTDQLRDLVLQFMQQG